MKKKSKKVFIWRKVCKESGIWEGKSFCLFTQMGNDIEIMFTKYFEDCQQIVLYNYQLDDYSENEHAAR